MYYTITCAIDIDECINKTLACPSDNDICINTYGSYECECNKGYSRNATNGLCEGI